MIYRQNLLKKILKFKVLYLIYSPHVGAKDSYKIHCQYLYAPLHQAVNLCLLILGNRLLIFKHRSNHKTNFFQHRSMCQVAGNPTLIHRNDFSMFLSNWTCFWQFDHATQSSQVSNLLYIESLINVHFHSLIFILLWINGSKFIFYFLNCDPVKSLNLAEMKLPGLSIQGVFHLPL